jgi:hypothetical protein
VPDNVIHFSDDHSMETCYSPSPPDQAIITMCTSLIDSKHTTLKFKDQIGHLNVIVVFDKRGTHSFISPIIMQILALPTINCTPLTVVTAKWY